MLEAVNVVLELEKAGVELVMSGDSPHIKMACIYHDDTNPSLVFNSDTSKFKCQACGVKGDIADFLAKLTGKSREEVLPYLIKEYGIATAERPVSVDLVERARPKIWEAGTLLRELRRRCISDQTIVDFKLGVDKNRITIPVPDLSGTVYVNIRKYLPGAPGDKKMANLKGRGKLHLYPYSQLKYERVLVCGGEIKALAAAQELNQVGVGCVAATGGEGAWDPVRFGNLLKGKTVYVCLDIDSKGKMAAQKLCREIYPYASEVSWIQLPLDEDLFPTGDINDYLKTGGTLAPLIEDSSVYQPRLRTIDWTEGEHVPRSIWEAVRADNIGERSQIGVHVVGLVDSTYSVPHQVEVECLQDQKCCGSCPVAVTAKTKFGVDPENPAVSAMVGQSDYQVDQIVGKAINIPAQCKERHIHVLAHRSVEVGVVSPQMELTSTDSGPRNVQKILSTTSVLEANEEYILEGRAIADPKTQETVFLASTAKPTLSSINTFEFDRHDESRIFQPDEWSVEGIDAQLNDLYDDLSVNVTHIRERRELHEIIDLAYHSVLNIKLERNVQRGWVEALVLGDSSQGKSQATECLQKHYNLGHKVDMKNATSAGIIGGLQQFGSTWVVSWGALPTHDRRLVIMEELEGADVEVLAAMTDVRSSGVAKVQKIQTGERLARCRLIALSNPRSGRNMNSYAFGVEAIMELCGQAADVRRFDTCICVTKEDHTTDVIHEFEEREIEHVYHSDLCHHLIMWGWTRKTDQVQFSKATIKKLFECSKQMCSTFHEQIPIVDAGSMRFKLARLAAALAVRTYSTEDEGQSVEVRPCHVEYITQLLTRTYSSPGMKYLQYSQKRKRSETLQNTTEIREQILRATHPRELVEEFLSATFLDENTLAAKGGFDFQDCRDMLNALIRFNAVETKGRGLYVLQSGFRKFLADFKLEKDDDAF